MNINQRQRLERKQHILQTEWDLRTEKLKQLRLALAIEPGAAVKFQLQQQIQAEETELKGLNDELHIIEQELSTLNFVQPPTINQIPSQPNFVDLRSDRKIDYTQLRDTLREQNWSEADRITRLLLLKLCWRDSASEWMINGRWSEEKFKQDIDQIPCIDLHTIDQLWMTYSDGHFGFSSQKRIYLEVGGRVDGEFHETDWDKFAFKIGWRQINYDYDQMIFNISAPEGHLPVCLWFGGLCFSRIALSLKNVEAQHNNL